MRIRYVIAAGSFFAFFAANAVFAVGSGSGGSTPPCTEDSYTCSNWSSCRSDSTTVRTCTALFDCPTAQTPKPKETETCVPVDALCNADVWTCAHWSACSADSTQTRTCALEYDCPSTETLKPSESKPCVFVPPASIPAAPADGAVRPEAVVIPKNKAECDADVWACADWSVCDPQGNQSRVCKRAVDCPDVSTPQPMRERRCSVAQCTEYPLLKERVRCRLMLEPAGMIRELENQYLPELCRTISEGEGRNACVARYKAFEPCWRVPGGEERFACSRKVLGMTENVAEQSAICRAKQGTESTPCFTALREKVFASILFRFYDLEQRAEDFVREGRLSIDDATNFVASVEAKKAEFILEPNFEERRESILHVRSLWKNMLEKLH